LAEAIMSGKGMQDGASAGKRAVRADALADGPMESAARKLLAQRIREYHPDRAFTGRCLDAMRFADRPLTDREKLTTLAVCRCYDSRKRERTLVNYVGYLKARRSDEVDLPGMLYEFRTKPADVLDVTKYGTWQMGRFKGAEGQK